MVVIMPLYALQYLSLILHIFQGDRKQSTHELLSQYGLIFYLTALVFIEPRIFPR